MQLTAEPTKIKCAILYVQYVQYESRVTDLHSPKNICTQLYTTVHNLLVVYILLLLFYYSLLTYDYYYSIHVDSK